jgi:outer membrane cobalamin receptor
MKSAFTGSLLLAAATLGVIAATPALAQDDAAGANEGNDIVVTAHRTEERLLLDIAEYGVHVALISDTTIRRAEPDESPRACSARLVLR